MIWLILLHRLRKHAMLHLVAPLVIGLIVESFIEGLITIPNYRLTSLPSWLGFYSSYSVLRTLLLFAGVFVTYIFIMVYIINKETKFRTNFTHLATLKNTLDNARSYFGISVIPIEEWFEPSMQVYLAKLFNRKLEGNDFEHERTLLFFSEGELNRATLPLMDEHYHGRCLAHMHRDCDIPLSYIGRKDIFKILGGLSDEDRVVLCCYPRWTGWRPFRVFRRVVPLRWLRWRIPSLDMAVVEMKDGTRLVLRISKHGTEVLVRKIKGEPAQPYLHFLDKIREEIYEDGTRQLKDDYDFVNIYHAHFSPQKIHTSDPPPGTKPHGASGNGCDEPPTYAGSEALAQIGSEALAESHAGAAEEESAYHAVMILPPDSTDGIEPPQPNKKNSRRTRAHPAPPST
ncbi:MAG: hypothetical protein M3444_00185 [Acidobacteriota bacterium]|nr:hypothetical protein [Acidobacteriota bacterium]MDQ5838500.1 hypothetical protein [Acidobacteriota bacterium]